MKKTTLSTLKQLSNVKEIKNTKVTQFKGGYSNFSYSTQIEISWGINNNGIGFVPPPGK